jgi:solute carrier family 39 (zinc transporter), member 1/2/3
MMNAFTAKIISIVSLGLGSLISGLLPALLTKSKLKRSSLLQTILLCFGAGILLATALVHILPEVSDVSIYSHFNS